MNFITNEPKFRDHPLQPLLRDAIAAETGGATTKQYILACKVCDWTLEFFKWHEEDGYAIEKLVWDGDSVFNELKEIYS